MSDEEIELKQNVTILTLGGQSFTTDLPVSVTMGLVEDIKNKVGTISVGGDEGRWSWLIKVEHIVGLHIENHEQEVIQLEHTRTYATPKRRG